MPYVTEKPTKPELPRLRPIVGGRGGEVARMRTELSWRLQERLGLLPRQLVAEAAAFYAETADRVLGGKNKLTSIYRSMATPEAINAYCEGCVEMLARINELRRAGLERISGRKQGAWLMPEGKNLDFWLKEVAYYDWVEEGGVEFLYNLLNELAGVGMGAKSEAVLPHMRGGGKREFTFEAGWWNILPSVEESSRFFLAPGEAFLGSPWVVFWGKDGRKMREWAEGAALSGLSEAVKDGVFSPLAIEGLASLGLLVLSDEYEVNGKMCVWGGEDVRVVLSGLFYEGRGPCSSWLVEVARWEHEFRHAAVVSQLFFGSMKSGSLMEIEAFLAQIECCVRAGGSDVDAKLYAKEMEDYEQAIRRVSGGHNKKIMVSEMGGVVKGVKQEKLARLMEVLGR